MVANPSALSALILRLPGLRQLARLYMVRQARAAMAARHWTDASSLYATVSWLDPKATGEWVQYGHALKESGRLTEAEHAYRRAIACSPHEADPRRQLAFLLKRMGRQGEANEAFLDGRAVAPHALDLVAETQSIGLTDEEMSARLIIAVMAIGAPTTTERQVKRPWSWFTPWQVRQTTGVAQRAAAARDWPGAADGYRAALRLVPFRASLWVQLGHALKEQRDLEGATSAYRRAMALAPHDPDPHLHLGHVLKEAGDREGAIVAYANAWRLQPEFGDVRRELRDYAGWTDDDIHKFGLGNWSTPRGRVSLDSQTGDRWARPPGLDPREAQVWADLTFALSR